MGRGWTVGESPAGLDVLLLPAGLHQRETRQGLRGLRGRQAHAREPRPTDRAWLMPQPAALRRSAQHSTCDFPPNFAREKECDTCNPPCDNQQRACQPAKEMVLLSDRQRAGGMRRRLVAAPPHFAAAPSRHPACLGTSNRTSTTLPERGEASGSAFGCLALRLPRWRRRRGRRPRQQSCGAQASFHAASAAPPALSALPPLRHPPPPPLPSCDAASRVPPDNAAPLLMLPHSREWCAQCQARTATRVAAHPAWSCQPVWWGQRRQR